MLLIQTPIAIGGLMLLVVGLAMRVSLLRRSTKIMLGDGGNPALFRAMRLHGNALEHALVLSVLALVLDLSRGARELLNLRDINWYVAGTCFLAAGVFARLVHAAFAFRLQPLHAFAATLTYLAEAGLCVVILVLAIFYR